LIGSSRFDKEPNLNSLKCPENDTAATNRELIVQEDHADSRLLSRPDTITKNFIFMQSKVC